MKELKERIMIYCGIPTDNTFLYCLSVNLKLPTHLAERILFDKELVLDCLRSDEETLIEGMAFNTNSCKKLYFRQLIPTSTSIDEFHFRYVMFPLQLADSLMIDLALCAALIKHKTVESALRSLVADKEEYPVLKVINNLAQEQLSEMLRNIKDPLVYYLSIVNNAPQFFGRTIPVSVTKQSVTSSTINFGYLDILPKSIILHNVIV